MIELHKRYTFTAPSGSISDTGIAQIQRLIALQLMSAAEWAKLNPTTTYRLPSLPDDWDWIWLLETGDYKGTFPKRVRNYYYKVHRLKCPDTFIQEIGNLARAHSSDGLTYTFDFTDQIDWEAGDFADDSSCYWNDRAGAKQMIEDNGGWAVRFFEDVDGIARAWVAPIHDDMYIVFNGYGFTTLQIARVLATWLNVSYKKIRLTNQGGTAYALYINDGAGYLLGNDQNAISSWEFGWDEIWVRTCTECGTGVNDDDVYIGADHEDYCQNCFYNLFDTCSTCGETHWQVDVTYIDGDLYCDDCRDHRFTFCDGCGDYVPHSANVRLNEETQEWECDNCAEGA